MTLADRIAAAPISWGVCEAPDWGVELPAERVLGEMRQLDLRATELGPTGYLGTDPGEVRELLHRHQFRLVGGFLPVVLHTDAPDFTEATAAIRTLAEAGAEVVVLAARSLDGSYDRAVLLDEPGWQALLGNLKRLQDLVAQHGLRAALHPHVGTAVENREAVYRLLESSDIPLCLDTGHLVIGGTDPLELLHTAADRVQHVHLKDVRLSVAATVHDASYINAVRRGMYTPLGDGDLDIAGIVAALEGAGYQGWYVLEQDSALYAEPPDGAGPIDDVRRSVDFLARL